MSRLPQKNEKSSELQVILAAEDVTVAFGGFVAVKGMNLKLLNRDLHFLIGPNGAGKTTMLDVICGKTKPISGSVKLMDGTELTKLKEHQIVRKGIGRKFQAPSIFASLTVEENLALAAETRRLPFQAIGIHRHGARGEAMERVVLQTGLQDRIGERAGALSHGEKQWLEIGMLLLQEPQVLLLDEPAAGMTDEETYQTGRLLQEIAAERSVVVVEHDMEFVREFAAKVTVMHEGKLLKEGTMAEVQADPRVAEVYLGTRGQANVETAER
ncbi:urea ABC transporter ATP-binding protein UrtD [Paenibacillus silvae]|jgi:urea transport system ATP-binding protein|uniref:urea ABC transporter ATP-binding protein UrtD n=1 Tax=Paenibacillus silvae TaxID=1325358 RepID=UPI0025A2C20F|nr:urea ABC transporter ATP-binding protein UrtD [Paenibacillus silvae]MDM5279300.1 urea ABC transporter ATP-binding protein UrtD [Paenibacillus silvae]